MNRSVSLALILLTAALSAQEKSAALDLPTVLTMKGPAVVRCADGLLAFGTETATATVTSISLKKNAVTARLSGDFANHPNKPELAELLLIAMENVLVVNTPSKLTTGDTVIEVMRNKEPVRCDVAEVVSAPVPAEFDKPVTFRQMNLGGRPIAIMNLTYLKKKIKRNTETCVIANTAPKINRPLAPELHSAFMEELIRKQQKFFKQVVQSDAGAAADAYELQVRVLGFGFIDGEGDVAFISFRVFDRGSGNTITHGRGFRLIGTKQDKDVRDFATIVACA